MYFNPRTHVGCDTISFTWTRRVTYFNPRTHVGCDFASTLTADSFANFNPRTHVGCDALHRAVRRVQGISIHAPTWGATWRRSRGTPSWHFNPRTHVGCALLLRTNLPGLEYFNPRTHVGCDVSGEVGQSVKCAISIHAPTWGATLKENVGNTTFTISIHAPTWGATLNFLRAAHNEEHFNPRTHVGCDPFLP